VCQELPITSGTARRYYGDWRKVRNREALGIDGRRWAFNDTGISEEVIELLGSHFDMSRNSTVRFVRRRQWLQRVLNGKPAGPSPSQSESRQETRLRNALEICVSLERYGVTPAALGEALAKLLDNTLRAPRKQRRQPRAR
jgi:hypothetical protein